MDPDQSAGTRFVLTGAGLVVLLAGLKVAAPLIVPLIFSGFLAVITAPMVLWMKARRVPAVVSVPLAVFGVIVAGSAFVALVGGSINQLIGRMPFYQDRLDTLWRAVVGQLRSVGLDVTLAELGDHFDAGSAMNLLTATLSGIASMLSDTLLVLLTMAFLLFEALDLPQKLRQAMGDPRADISYLAKVASEINRYLVIKTYVSLATGAILGLFLWVVGVDFPLLWGLCAFLLNYVPNIGSIIAAIPPVTLALVQFGVARALVVLAGFVAVNMVIGNVIEPGVMGRRLGLSSLVVFLSLVFWGWLWGPMGMLLSVPLTMIVKIMLEHSGQWGWVALLMDAPHPEKNLPPVVSVRPPPPP